MCSSGDDEIGVLHVRFHEIVKVFPHEAVVPREHADGVSASFLDVSDYSARQSDVSITQDEDLDIEQVPDPLLSTLSTSS